MERKFKSKIDPWVYIVVLTCIIFPILWGIFWFIYGGSYLFAAIIFVVADAGLIIPVFLDTSYTFEQEGLHVKSGYVVDAIVPYGDILEYRQTNESGASPALSSDRIKIFFKTGENTEAFLFVSPAQKLQFIELLREKMDQFSEKEQQM